MRNETFSSIPYGRQQIRPADIAAVQRAVEAPFLTQGPGVAEFEARLAEAVGARYAVALNSGTAALHAAYAAAGVGPGKRVVTTPITFAATANAARYLGANLGFVDVDEDYALIDPEELAGAVEASDQVIAPVHFAGASAPMERLRTIADRVGAIVVEDAAHALGATYRDSAGREHLVGACAHSEMTCFSFHPVKHITTGEGGAVTTNDLGLYRRLMRFRSHGITRDPTELSRDEGPWFYEQVELGFNYRLPDLNCALGTSQLGRLPEMLAARRRVARRYDEAFQHTEGLRTLAQPPWSQSAYHLYVIRVRADIRRAVFEGLRGRGIGVNVHYLPVYRHPYYRATGFERTSLVRAERYYAEAISVPLFSDLTDEECGRVIESVHEVVAGALASRL